MPGYVPLTRNDPADIAREIRRVVRCPGESTSRDRHHRRKIHSIVVFDEPVCLYRDHRSDASIAADGMTRIPPTYEVARGAAHLPGRGLTTVRCVVRGESRYADWESVADGDEVLPNLIDYLDGDMRTMNFVRRLQDALDCAVPGEEGAELLVAWRREQHRIRANND